MSGERVIRFRGLDSEGVWRYGYYYVEAVDGDKLGFEYVHFIKEVYGDHFKDFEVRPETVGQFTGVTTGDGTDVYEGDLVVVDVLAGKGEKARNFVRGPVKWIDNGFGIDFAGYARQWVRNIRVVGNLHTPEVRK